MLLAGALAVGEATEPVLPSPHLLAPLLAGVVVALAGFAPGRLPPRVNRSSQALLGVLMGSLLPGAELRRASAQLLPLTAVTAATVVLGLAAALLLRRVGGVDRATATLGMVPGGSAAVVAIAEELDADPRLVAFLQYLRVAAVAASAPLVVRLLAPGSAGTGRLSAESWRLVSAPAGAVGQATGLALLVTTALAGARLGRLVRLPSPALLGPAVLTAAAAAFGTVPGFAPAGPLRSCLFTLVGLDMGLRFTRSAVTRLRRLLPLALACTAVLSAGCAALAWILAAAVGIPLTDAYLATTPGGINAVLAAAVASHADVALVSSVQSLRLIAMVLLAPLLVRFAVRRAHGVARAPCGAVA